MSVIRNLGERVEKEHTQYLRDHQRTDERSINQSIATTMTPDLNPETTTFESLVNRGTAPVATVASSASTPTWDDDVWGSILNDNQVCALMTFVLIV